MAVGKSIPIHAPLCIKRQHGRFSSTKRPPGLQHALACVTCPIHTLRTSSLKVNNNYRIQSAPRCILVTTIAKAGIITGIIFAGFMMIMLGISVLPNVINDYDRNQVLNQSDEKLEKLFTESKEYAAFAERFPDYVAEFNRGSHDARFQMGALNPETGNALVMDMRYRGSGCRYILLYEN